MSVSLLLLGHGSHLSSDSSAPIRQHTATIAGLEDFDDVRMGFWKEEPSLSRALDGCTSDEAVAVPLFMANGYFTREVIPREMRLSGRVSTVDGKRVRYADPIGTHPSLADIVLQRATEAGAGDADAIVVLGHGTPRSTTSAENVYSQARFVARLRPNAEVTTVFMDQEPNLRDVFSRFQASSAVMVPLFVSDGWHVGRTIPEDLDLEGVTRRSDGRTLRFARAVGTHPNVAEVVRELASEAMAW